MIRTTSLLPKCYEFLFIHHTSRTHARTHTQPFYGPLGFCPDYPDEQSAGIRKVKPIWINWSKR